MSSATQQLDYTAHAPGGKTTFSVDLTLTYEDSVTNPDGSFTITGVSGTFTVTETKKGVATPKTYNIDKLQKQNHLGDNDNHLFLDSKFPILDRRGLTFLISEPRKGNMNKVEEVNLFYNPNTKTINQFGRSVSAKTSIPATPSRSTSFAEPAVTADACYAAGTRIATARGEVSVEALVVGDRVVTSSGALREVRWLGHRDVDCRRHPRREATLPIRIAAHAFGENRPARDLIVSPGHSICVDLMGEALIPAAALVNGTTIVQVEVASVQYWHVELEAHDIILAENLPAESYLEMGNRGFFAESGIVAFAATPDAKSVTHADFCRPFHAAGPLVAAVRARLAARAGQVGRRVKAA